MHLAGAAFQQSDLVLPTEGLKARKAFAELHDELDGEDGGLGDVPQPPVVGAGVPEIVIRLLVHVRLDPLEVLLRGLLKLLLQRLVSDE